MKEVNLCLINKLFTISKMIILENNIMLINVVSMIMVKLNVF
jgi:hypothetical protein